MYYSRKLFRHPGTQNAVQSRAPLTGGIAITEPEAIALRKVIFGSAANPPRGEWTRTPFRFNAAHEELAFGLICPRNATRGVQSVVQAFILKQLVFDLRPRAQKSVPVEQLDRLLRPSDELQADALLGALAEILWTVGDRSAVCVALPGDASHVAHSHAYFVDGVTERLCLFRLTCLEDLQIHLKRYMYFVNTFTDETGAGALLFLYCAVLTRTTEKVISDLDAPKGAYLMGPNEEGSLNVITLLLTGHATPYLHNGVIYVGDEDHYAMPQFGILARATVGLLVLGAEADIAMMPSAKTPGSRLKTPTLPIWITCARNHYGVLFNSNRELLRNYHAEKRFELHCYTCAGCYMKMTVDNRSDDDAGTAAMAIGLGIGAGSVLLPGFGASNLLRSTPACASTEPSSTSSAAAALAMDSIRSGSDSNAIERLIHTKWTEAKVTFLGPTTKATLTC